MPAGDPDTRPDVETVFVPSSRELDRDARDWENCALVPWALHLPPGVGARAIEALLVERLRLQPREVTVLVHQPEPYLIRFEDAEHCKAARDRGRFTGHGIDICLRPWRSLTHALGMRIFYRVRLCLDGIPIHAWTPDIVERVIGRRCALQCINTDLVQPRDSRHIDLWAWTVDPSEIPKRVWLFFTNGPADRSSALFISEKPPEFWHQGARFQVFLHMPVIEDYSAVEGNLQAAIDNPAGVVPLRRYYDWRYGLPDGAPPEARPAFPARLPRPPREPGKNNDGRRGDDGSCHGPRDGRGANGARGKERCDRGDRGRRSDRSSARSTSSRNSCRGMDFHWPTRKDHDDDDYDHPGRGRDASTGFTFFSLADTEPVRRERTRSPRRRDGGFWRRRGWNDDHPEEAWRPHHDDDDELPAGRIRTLHRLHNDTGAAGHDSSTNEVSKGASLVPNTQMQEEQLNDYINLAQRFAAWINRTGDDAWSAPAAEDGVPASRVFARLNAVLSPPTTEEVERALQALQLPAAAEQGLSFDSGGKEVAAATDAGITIPSGGVAEEAEDDGLLNGPAQSVDGLSDEVAHGAGPDDGDGPQEDAVREMLLQHPGPTQHGPLEQGPRGPDLFQDPVGDNFAAHANGPRPHDAVNSAVHASDRDLMPHPTAVDELFTTPAPPLVPCPPVDVQVPIEVVLKEYIQSIPGPLPDYVVAALATLLDIDDDDADKMTEALLQHAGDGIAQLQEEQELLMVRDV